MLSDVRCHLVALLALYVLLLVEYGRFVYRHYFQLMGFSYQMQPVSFMLGLLMLAVLMAMLFAVPHRNDRMYTLSLVVASLYALPQIVLFQVGGATPFAPVYSILFCLLLLLPSLQFPQLPLPRVPESRLAWVLPVVCLVALLPFVLAYGFHFDTSVFALDEHIYDVRAAAASRATVFTNYLKGPLANVLLPALLVYGLSRRWRGIPWALLAVLLMGYLFLTTPQKSIFFSLFLVAVFYFFRSGHAKGGVFLYGLLAVCLGSVLLQVATGNMLVESIAVRRLFFIPALVTDNYFTFFHHNPLCFSYSFLASLTNAYPYHLDPAHLIGDIMYHRTYTSCNTGIIGDGFMNFGHLGAFFFVVLVALVLRFVDSVPYHHRYFGLVVLLVVNFLNGALFTTMLTHGGLMLLLVVLFLLPVRSHNNNTTSL